MGATQIAKSKCIELQSNPGFYLEKNAAYAWDRSCLAFGKQVILTGAWRSYAVQETIFLERYQTSYIQFAPGRVDARLWRGRIWYRKPGYAAAATPGSSNHGGGVAVDVKTRREAGDPPYSQAVIFAGWSDEDRTAFLKIANQHGWYDTEGKSVEEHWHLTYYPHLDRHRGVKPNTKPKPQPKPGTAAFIKGRVKRVQGAVGATKDGIWGDNTDLRLYVLYRSSTFGGNKFPHTVEFAQRVVGTGPDGYWGDDSMRKHTAAVKRIQRVLGLKATGIYDRKLHNALAELKRKSK